MVSLHTESPSSPTTATLPAESGAPVARGERAEDNLYCAGLVHILVLDDDAGVARVVENALARKNFQIDVITDPVLMETTLREKVYDIVILDYVIPGLESERLLGCIREYQRDASVIVITGFPSMDSAVNCLRAGTFDYLTKPFQVAQLQRVVRRCLEKKGLLRMSEEALRESLGAAIRERRKALGLTLAQMAQRTNVSLGYLSQIELGKNSASIETLYRISLGLGVKIADLFQAVQLPS